MYAIDIIRRVDEKRPNSISIDQKVVWLARCDHLIWDDVIATHHGGECMKPFRGEIEADAEYRCMMVREPYEEMYEYYLMAQIDLTNGDTDHYNNDTLLYNDALKMFSRWWHRSHLPKNCVKFRV